MRFLTKEQQTEFNIFPAARHQCQDCPHCDREYPDWCDEECDCIRCDPKQQVPSFTNYCCVECSQDIFINNLEIYTKCKCKGEFRKKRKTFHKQIREEIMKEQITASKKKFQEEHDINEFTNKSRDSRFKAVQFLFDSMQRLPKVSKNKSKIQKSDAKAI